MNTPNPVVYEFVRNAWENNRREEGLPVQSLAALDYGNDEVGSGIRRVLKAIGDLFGSGQVNKQYSTRTNQQAAMAK